MKRFLAFCIVDEFEEFGMKFDRKWVSVAAKNIREAKKCLNEQLHPKAIVTVIHALTNAKKVDFKAA